MWTKLQFKIGPLVRLQRSKVKYSERVIKRCLSIAGSRAQQLKQKIPEEQYIISSPYSDVTIPNISFSQYLFDAQEKHAGRIGFVCSETGETFTHDEIRIQCHKLASAFARLGVCKGETVALISPNCPEFVSSYMSVPLLGAVISAFNYHSTAKEIEYHLLNSESVAVITHKDKLKDILLATKNNPNIRLIIAIGSTDDVDGVIPMKKLLKDDGKGIPNIQIDQSDVFTLPYSSGTTGLPKGVMLTHRNLVANSQQIQHPEVNPIVDATDEFQEVFLGLLPMYHIYGMVACIFNAIMSGSRIVTMKEFNQRFFVDSIRKYQMTSLYLVPPLLSFLESSSLAPPDLLSNTRSVFCGAAPIGESLLENFFNKFGRHISYAEGYGMTELSPVTHISKKGNYVLGSCGPLVPNTQAKLIDISTNRTLRPGEGEGELCIKGPQVMKGYFKNEKATSETIKDGWLHTGDVARVDKDGNTFIVDRIKELIKVKGLQVAPAELENILRLHKSVEDVAVIGIPDDRAGELPKAFIVPKEGSTTTEEDFKNFVSEQVSDHKRIAEVTFIGVIPKSAAGKILRRELRNL